MTEKNTENETEPSREGWKHRMQSLGEKWAEVVTLAVLSIPIFAIGVLGGIAKAILSKLPKREAVYRKMIEMGYESMYRNTDGHVVCNTIYGEGKAVPRPAQHDTTTGKLQTNNGEEWTATSGLQPVWIGDAPVVTGVADHHELVDPIAARIAEAVDLSPRRQQAVKEYDEGYYPVEVKDGGEQAVADGAGAGLLPRSTTFSDVWVDVSNPDESADGMIVSMEKAYEMHWDKASSEEMQNQETRGILAAKDPNTDKKKALIFVGLFAGGLALGLFGPPLAEQIAPGSDGSNGAGAPIMSTLSLAVDYTKNTIALM